MRVGQSWDDLRVLAHGSLPEACAMRDSLCWCGPEVWIPGSLGPQELPEIAGASRRWVKMEDWVHGNLPVPGAMGAAWGRLSQQAPGWAGGLVLQKPVRSLVP